MLPTSAEEIISRLKEAVNVKTDGQLAKYLSISRQNIGAARKREDVPTGWIHKVAELTGCSMDWLSFGQGSKMRVKYTNEGAQSYGQVASPESPYGSQNVPEGSYNGDWQQDAEGFSFGRAVEMLARIYNAGDNLQIDAVNAIIKAICEAIESRQRELRSTKEMEDLKKRLSAFKKQIPPE
jgi:hypothetical protein